MSVKKITSIKGTGISIRGNDIDTDRIIPARYLKEITFARMGDYPFYDERFKEDGSLKDHPFNKEDRRGAAILVVNDNFGCGSSREHAPQALFRWGIKAVLAESLAEIFAGNCTMIGMAAVTLSPSDIREIQTALEADSTLEIKLNLLAKTVKCGSTSYTIMLPESGRQALIEGTWDSSALLLSRLDMAKKIAASLPYMNRFES
ncbi:3-isopropylmalate dehydratase small subunit [Oceanispirochaeta sp.]|jgi:3-isopropylmalate/(R)-2-methylmalate dehydratase small subunit|uniref:3-isopropylmalate dehydratase small subunit n=1 Tax=Oceanispirochaeta sp. TaxID=2035350 RepID=UPI002631A20F|nr:3-isopropylmalate dehydratase small subunit [Oceanispirochaeta sp.]MDA3957715.1 3-isopropylmalate dehydratase small subunit [Oceanispirochaeta sp.]